MDAKEMGEMPAYPQTEQVGERGEYRDVLIGGMTKREAFAMAAMQGTVSNPGLNAMSDTAVADFAVRCADALLAELAKDPT